MEGYSLLGMPIDLLRGKTVYKGQKKQILNYWKNHLRTRGYNLSGLKVAQIANLLAKLFKDDYDLGKSNGYTYMLMKYEEVIGKKKQIATDTAKGCVYFIGNEHYGWVKIGKTTNLTARLSALQTGSPCILSILGYKKSNTPTKEERELHLKFSKYKMHNEWYLLSDDIKGYISTLEGK